MDLYRSCDNMVVVSYKQKNSKISLSQRRKEEDSLVQKDNVVPIIQIIGINRIKQWIKAEEATCWNHFQGYFQRIGIALKEEASRTQGNKDAQSPF